MAASSRAEATGRESRLHMLPGIDAVVARHAAYNAFVYLLDGDQPLLVDTAVRGEPERAILPFLRESRLVPHRVVITHGHADHFGGLAEIVAAFPGITVTTPAGDAAWIESVDKLVEEMYRGYARAAGFPVDESRIEWVRSLIGGGVPVAEQLKAGDLLHTGRFDLEVVFLPGHSPGHIGLLDSERRFAIVADALLGRGLPDRDGYRPAAPLYSDVPAYRQTLATIGDWDIPLLLTGHMPPLRDAAAAGFVAESKAFVAACEAAVGDILAATREPLTFVDIAGRAGEALGRYPAGLPSYPCVLAHLQEFERQGLAVKVDRGSQLAWRGQP